MSQGIKNVLGVAVIITILSLAGASLWYVNAYSRNTEPTSFRSFSISGSGKASALPDVARFTARVITEGDTNLGNSQNKNTEKINAVIIFIKSKGIDGKDIKTQNYSVEPRYQYFDCSASGISSDERGGKEPKPCPPPEIVGYTVQQTVAITVREKNFSAVGALLSGVVQNGANSVSQLSFEVDDPSVVQSEARTQAIQKAQAKARSMAEAGGFSLGRLLSIEEGYASQPYYGGYETYAAVPSAALDEAKSAPTIEPGSQEVNVDVTLKYEIE